MTASTSLFHPSAAPSSPRLTSDLAVCVWIPLFALRCEESRRPELVGKPVAILSPDDSRRLWQASSQARHAGVRPGMTISQAIGLCASLTLCEPDPVFYDERSAHLLLQLCDLSPVIEPAELGRVFVGVDGVDGLYGRPEQQLEIVTGLVARSGGSAPRLGWARGKFTAWVAASRARPGEGVVVRDTERIAFLASQPLAVLALSPDTGQRLGRLGLKTLGQLAGLPESAVVSQFGREGRHAWRMAAGLINEPVIGRETPEPIIISVDFPAPLADRELLVYALDRLLEQALRHPRRTGWRVQTVRARAGLEQGASWMAEAILKDPSSDRARILAPLVTRLEQAPPTGAVEQLTVEFTAFAPGTSELQLFARDATSAARADRHRALRSAVEEIKTRLARPLLYRIIEVHPWSRIPERRYALIDFDP
jgi:DNA polymerase-4/protein ImuB